MIASLVMSNHRCNHISENLILERQVINIILDWGTGNPCSLSSKPINLLGGNFAMEIRSKDGFEWYKITPQYINPNKYIGSIRFAQQ